MQWKNCGHKFPEEWTDVIIRCINTKNIISEVNVKEAHPDYFEMEGGTCIDYSDCEWLDESPSPEWVSVEDMLQQLNKELKDRIDVRSQNHNLRLNLWNLVYAVGRLLDDKYTEGDAKVRQELWTAMHRTNDAAREYLHNEGLNAKTPNP